MINLKTAIKTGCICSIFILMITGTGYADNHVGTSESDNQIQEYRDKWDNMSPEEKAEMKERKKEVQDKWDNMPDEDKAEMKQRAQENKKKWDNMPDEDKAKIKTRNKERRMKNRNQ